MPKKKKTWLPSAFEVFMGMFVAAQVYTVHYKYPEQQTNKLIRKNAFQVLNAYNQFDGGDLKNDFTANYADYRELAEHNIALEGESLIKKTHQTIKDGDTLTSTMLYYNKGHVAFLYQRPGHNAGVTFDFSGEDYPTHIAVSDTVGTYESGIQVKSKTMILDAQSIGYFGHARYAYKTQQDKTTMILEKGESPEIRGNAVPETTQRAPQSQDGRKSRAVEHKTHKSKTLSSAQRMHPEQKTQHDQNALDSLLFLKSLSILDKHGGYDGGIARHVITENKDYWLHKVDSLDRVEVPTVLTVAHFDNHLKVGSSTQQKDTIDGSLKIKLQRNGMDVIYRYAGDTLRSTIRFIYRDKDDRLFTYPIQVTEESTHVMGEDSHDRHIKYDVVVRANTYQLKDANDSWYVHNRNGKHYFGAYREWNDNGDQLQNVIGLQSPAGQLIGTAKSGFRGAPDAPVSNSLVIINTFMHLAERIGQDTQESDQMAEIVNQFTTTHFRLPRIK